MPYRQLSLRRRCEAILGQLDLAERFCLEGLCTKIAEQRGRPIRLHPLPREAAESGVCGLWVGTATTDYVFYEAQTSPLHQEHIVLHELGHILFGHHSLEGEEADGAAPVVLGRTNYTTRQEQEAEMLASMIRTRAGLGPRPNGSSGDPLGRLGSAMGVR
ncbi:ImmA/IrrE family metallo-endopeptidase [Streptomyces sp. NPDC012888]|uniref:ImmA/IrrE family metallo-endopeptidase n=1 Tax=Streptomyces sp. NPDC012888 TaxID=3364855 RepID=UPI00369D3309